MVRVFQVASRFFRLHAANTLHKHTRDDLKAVGNPVIQFLDQNLLFAEQCGHRARGISRLSLIEYRKDEARNFIGVVIENVRIRNKAARRLARTMEVHLVSIDGGISRSGRGEQRAELGNIPLAIS
ncbi:hypothetical protein [Parafrankia sp. BMG5.11]|uniref:hypothetical protein n=1 Tax=Parafrankia sp. BMG5.11 TaxID=222540 RepID=UPI00103DEB67|nr:hypothetical protein [Parafrankia sp. BMG5.11]TCJ39093.1 hypothetical protein E0504_12510 [Parafrankia sp. BMG5.11]